MPVFKENAQMVAIAHYDGPLPALTTAQMVEVDRAMIEDYHIELIQMMENAGRNLAHLARLRFLEGSPPGKRVAVLAGTGGNGGGALVAARRLHNWGAAVNVFITKPAPAFTPIPAHQLDSVQRLGAPVGLPEDLPTAPPFDLILDGVIGYSLRGAPHGGASTLINWANSQSVPILALDAPSGLDAGTGRAYHPAIRAAATLTLALPKQGVLLADTAGYVGELYLADIGVPPALYAGLGLTVGPLFARADVVRLR
jgi:NAD(P)H-hydrate epimerase